MSSSSDSAMLRAPVVSMPRRLHRVYAAAARIVRSNHTLYRVLFGHWPARQLQGQLWDWTTLALAAALRRYARLGFSLLDMGTGPAGVLAVYAKQKLGAARVCGVDHLPELLYSAAATAERCRVDVEFSCSSLFANVQGKFDLIVFNGPYIPSGEGWRVGALQAHSDERRWSGGVTGYETIGRFLREAPNHLNPAGRILLGVNHFYLTPEAILGAVIDAGLVQVDWLPNRLTQSCVYVLRHKDGTDRLASAGPQGMHQG